MRFGDLGLVRGLFCAILNCRMFSLESFELFDFERLKLLNFDSYKVLNRKS